MGLSRKVEVCQKARWVMSFQVLKLRIELSSFILSFELPYPTSLVKNINFQKLYSLDEQEDFFLFRSGSALSSIQGPVKVT